MKGAGTRPNDTTFSGRIRRHVPTAGGDNTCGNWRGGEGSASVGTTTDGLRIPHMKSWNSSHGSRGCSQDQLKASGGAGLFYCFAAN